MVDFAEGTRFLINKHVDSQQIAGFFFQLSCSSRMQCEFVCPQSHPSCFLHLRCMFSSMNLRQQPLVKLQIFSVVELNLPV